MIITTAVAVSFHHVYGFLGKPETTLRSAPYEAQVAGQPASQPGQAAELILFPGPT